MEPLLAHNHRRKHESGCLSLLSNLPDTLSVVAKVYMRQLLLFVALCVLVTVKAISLKKFTVKLTFYVNFVVSHCPLFD